LGFEVSTWFREFFESWICLTKDYLLQSLFTL
jgi:hypothetical protein